MFYQSLAYIEYAIAPEKEIKGWRREKIAFVNAFNLQWRYLNNEA